MKAGERTVTILDLPREELPVDRSANRKIKKLQIWVEYRFSDVDGKRGAKVRVPINGAVDLTKITSRMPAPSPDLTEGVPQSLHVEVTFEGGHTAYCEIGQLGGAFGGLTINFNEIVES